MLLVLEHASSFSYERPLKDDGMLTTPPCATIAPLFRLLTRAAGIVRSVLVICGFQNLFLFGPTCFRTMAFLLFHLQFCHRKIYFLKLELCCSILEKPPGIKAHKAAFRNLYFGSIFRSRLSFFHLKRVINMCGEDWQVKSVCRKFQEFQGQKAKLCRVWECESPAAWAGQKAGRIYCDILNHLMVCVSG